MRESRGMGIMNPSKMPKAKTIRRKDNPDEVTVYAKGGSVSSRADGVAKKGKTHTKMVTMKKGGSC